MGRVARALMLHELLERTRDKWVLVTSILFAVLTSAVALYGRKAGGNAVGLAGPSMITLASLFVPLVALVLSHDAVVGERERNTLGLLLSLPISRLELVFAKFIGRSAALTLAVCLGFGTSALFAGQATRLLLPYLLGPTLLLGLSFLAIGVLLSATVKRQVTAASLIVVIWFCLVFFYDLGLISMIVGTDGAISSNTVGHLVLANPAGLYRVQLMSYFTGPQSMGHVVLVKTAPGIVTISLIWLAWIVGPVLLSGILLLKKKVV